MTTEVERPRIKQREGESKIIADAANILLRYGYRSTDGFERPRRNLVKNLKYDRLFPRFHLIIHDQECRLDVSLHLDMREHRVETSCKEVAKELRRLVDCVERIDNNRMSENAQPLLDALRHTLFFGVADRVTHLRKKGKDPLRNLVRTARKGKTKKARRARWRETKFSLDSEIHEDFSL